MKKRKKQRKISIIKKRRQNEKNRGKSVESIKWITFGIGSVLYKVYPINDKSETVYAVYFIILMILLNTSLYKHRNENLGVRYNFALAITLNLLTVYVLIGIGLDKFNPSVLEKYRTILGVFAVVGFLIFLGVVICGSEKSNRNHED